ncbi:hypothetical protein ACJX0J_011898, partial [Zea mays]
PKEADFEHTNLAEPILVFVNMMIYSLHVKVAFNDAFYASSVALTIANHVTIYLRSKIFQISTAILKYQNFGLSTTNSSNNTHPLPDRVQST